MIKSYHLLNSDNCHNPYFNRWFSAMEIYSSKANEISYVTILILIDGFLQSRIKMGMNVLRKRHNPYFNRWFSAI